ncbi:glycine-rich domain-containing protein [Streptomyces sp. NPDC020607]|uniref:glycine-rich domain-containing protein n=1 Tax=Streptomyces sp. NPDC020607 TaxID=3365082 RepID=UPI00378A154B
MSTSTLRTGRTSIDADLFESLAAFLVVQEHLECERAEEIADQAAAFVITAATATTPMVPSDDVDLGLHALILHTREYAALCQKHAGRFLHHNATPTAGGRDPEQVAASARAMKAAGFRVLDHLWVHNGQNLGQCDSDCGRPYGQA